MTRKKYTHRRNQLMQLYIVHRGTPSRPQKARFNELYDKAAKQNFDPCPPANDCETGHRRQRYKTREYYKKRQYYTVRRKRHWRLVRASRTIFKYRTVKGSVEDCAPYAVLLDYIGVRPLDEFGWLCIGDTPDMVKRR